MSAPGCGACGAHFREAWHGYGYERSCRCSTCWECGREFKEYDDAGPRIASSDEDAARFGDDPRCDDCWAEVKAG